MLNIILAPVFTEFHSSYDLPLEAIKASAHRCFSGKSTLLAVLGNREVPIPEHVDIFHLTREMPASDKTALECVMEVDEERIRLEELADSLIACEDDGNYR